VRKIIEKKGGAHAKGSKNSQGVPGKVVGKKKVWPKAKKIGASSESQFAKGF